MADSRTARVIALVRTARPGKIGGFMHTGLTDGDHYERQIAIETPQADLDPVALAYQITEGTLELADVAGFGALHGWTMPYRSEDGSVTIFEFEFDREPATY